MARRRSTAAFGGGSGPGRFGHVLALALLLAPAACELTEVTIADSDDVLLVEAYVVWAPPAPRAAATAFVHGTLDPTRSLRGPSPDLTIQMIAESGERSALLEVPAEVCVSGASPEATPGRCYAGALGQSVGPGTRVTLELETADGRSVTGLTRLPADFDIVSPVASGGTCRVPERRLIDVVWTTSPGAWAYPSETSLRGVRRAFIPKDPKFELLDDPLVLFGLAISDQDTTVSFPDEYGLFDRFSDDVTTKALIELQDGLQNGISAVVTVAAADRNYVNWQRGGNFNPSGLVRVPSLRGDGTGVLGSTVLRTVEIEVGIPTAATPECEGVRFPPT